jgi:hypothetical protein
MVALEFGERLRVGVEVAEGKRSPLLGDGAALLPAGGNGNEVVGCREFDVDRQVVLQLGDGAQDGVLLGDEFEVDVDGGRAPAEQDGSRAACQVADSLVLRGGVEGAEEAENAFGVG